MGGKDAGRGAVFSWVEGEVEEDAGLLKGTRFGSSTAVSDAVPDSRYLETFVTVDINLYWRI